MSLKEGQKAPEFNLPADGGKEIKLSDYKGKNVVLYFYPKDNTPGCTQETKDFRDHMDEFGKSDTVILGISKDSVKSHDKFKEKLCVPFDLVSDENGSTTEEYGVWKQKSMFGKKYMGIERTTFLIDKQGVIQKIWPKVKVTGHVKDVLTAVQGL